MTPRHARLHGAFFAAVTLGLTACTSGGSEEAASEWRSSLSQQEVTALGGEQAADKLQALYRKAVEAGEQQVVIYGPGVESNKSLYDQFNKRFPEIRVEGVQALGAELLTKVNNEFASGQHVADITGTGSTTTVQLYDQDRYASYRPFTLGDVPAHCVGPDQAFFCSSISAFGIVYNTNKVAEDEAPRGWEDLLDPRWKGKMAIWGSPDSSGPSGGLLTQMLYDERYTEEYVRELATQQVTVSSGTLLSEVATGQHVVGFPVPSTYYDDAKRKGAPLGFVYPMQGGNYLVDTYLGMLRNAPHPNAAKLFINYVHTSEAGQIYSQELGDYSPAAATGAPSGFPSLSEVDDFADIPLKENRQVYNSTLADIEKIWD